MPSWVEPGNVRTVIPQPRLEAPVAGPLADSAWWAYGLALHERLAGGQPAIGDAQQRLHGSAADVARRVAQARQRLVAWRSAYEPSDFTRRLAEAGLDETALLALLAESQASLAARVERPAWVDVVERAVRRAEATDITENPSWREAFAMPLRPFVADAVEQVSDHPVVEQFAAKLSRRLVKIATRTFAHEHNKRPGPLADFARRMAEPQELATLVTDYPVLARMLGEACLLAVESTVEILTRFSNDRAAIVETLLNGVDPGRLTAVETGMGDAHRRGRGVAVLSFESGARVVYKPRDLVAHQRFGAMVSWLGLDLRTPDVLVRPGYGWLEFIPRRELADLDAAESFYRRQGALLALLHVVRAADVHCENLIACGDQPVLVDAETLFQSGLRTSGVAADPAARALADSVYRTALLPMMVVGDNGAMEVSGLGGERGQTSESQSLDWEQTAAGELRLVRRATMFRGSDNRPRLGECELDAASHEKALLAGFRLGYDAIMRGSREFTALVEACADTEVRVVVRHTKGYATLLAESTHPELLADAIERDRVFDLLWTESAHDPVRWSVCRHEQHDLWSQDIPLFTARADATVLLSSDGQPIPGALAQSGLAYALDTLAAMGEEDRRDQEWIISATLATLRSTVDHRGANPTNAGDTEATRERLLAAACAIADQIVARGMTERDRVNWLGLEPVDDRRWMVLPMGAGLASGYTGVALFLAQLAELTGKSRYGEVARQALGAIPRLYTTLSTRPDLVEAVGCGGLNGFGGIAYALARLTTLLGDDDVRGWTGMAVRLAARAAGPASQPGVAMGLAGCLAAMTAVHNELGLAEAAQVAKNCANQLAEFGPQPDAGFANGQAGIGWALTRDSRTASAGRSALTGLKPVGDEGMGWCSGLAGLAAAHAALPGGPVVEAGDRPMTRDLSLCHGELGITEALIVTGQDTSTRAGRILDLIDRHGTPCGTPGGVTTPGLLTGLAGVGYGLLRLGFRERVPSVLLFEQSKPS